jgi:hypothetical protein
MIDNLIPIRGIIRQLENDIKVLETVRLHLGEDASIKDVSERAVHFVSGWWRAGEDIYWMDGGELLGSPAYRDYLLDNDNIREAVVETVRWFYAQF